MLPATKPFQGACFFQAAVLAHFRNDAGNAGGHGHFHFQQAGHHVLGNLDVQEFALAFDPDHLGTVNHNVVVYGAPFYHLFPVQGHNVIAVLQADFMEGLFETKAVA